MGSVPAAIIKSNGDISSETLTNINHKLMQDQGELYDLEGGIIPLQSLGLDHWPLNATGKILKSELLARLLARLSEKQANRM